MPLTLPTIMVAPNGARRMKTDHAKLPVTIAETVETAKACYNAGAGAIHAHVRHPETHEHILDAELYKKLITAIKQEVPGMTIQITTEAVGRYEPQEQMDVVYKVKPESVSVALREIMPEETDTHGAAEFYRWCEANSVAVQHILYSPEDVNRLARLTLQNIINPENLSVLYVLGRYAKNLESDPADLTAFLKAAKDFPVEPDWMVCAFGKAETAALQAAIEAGGKARVGFENSLYNKDGSIASSNEERVAEIKTIFDEA